MHKVTVNRNLTPIKLMKDLKIGQFAIISDPTTVGHNGDTVVKAYDGVVVSLFDPRNTWSKGSGDLLQIKPIEPGSIITIEVKEVKSVKDFLEENEF